MKKYGFLGWVVGLFLVSAPMMHSQNEQVYHWPFVIEFSRLSYYLELEPFRQDEVARINTFFIDQQEWLSNDNISQERKQKRFEKVLYVNLKLMKEALSTAQYQKYLRLINATNNLRMMAGDVETLDVAFIYFDALPFSKEGRYIQDVLTRNRNKSPLTFEQWIAANQAIPALIPAEEPEFLLFPIETKTENNDAGLIVQARMK